MDGPRSTPSPFWLHSCTSLAGTSHLARRAPCQDASAVLRLGGAGEIVILALSDGAGSATHSDIGAQTVVARWHDYFQTLLHQCPDPHAVLAECGPAELHAILADIRNCVERDALAFETAPAEFSATLLGAVLTPSGALVAQVGDGCWVGLVDGILGCLTWPTGGEFAGQTVFATSESAPHFLQWTHLSSAPQALAGFTDGLERLLLDFHTFLPAAGFFRPVFQALKESPQSFGVQLEEYLESGAVCERTDDDKSIAIVLNAHADL
jgi:hypothetical protein